VFTAEEALTAGLVKDTGPAQLPQPVADPTDPTPKKIPRGFVRVRGITDTEAEVTLNDGRKVLLKSPNAATQFITSRILTKVMPEPPASGYPENLTWNIKALMYVDSIDGKKVVRPTDGVEAQDLMNQLGDEGMDAVSTAYFRHFVAREIDLPL
jgi:hypothetical protein